MTQPENAAPILLVIADDLTGANDTGVQFAKCGIRTFVFVTPDFESFPAGTEVVVVNTESRHTAPVEAAARVARVAAEGVRAGVRFFYKKTDSTLRGNLGGELEALLLATGADSLAFVPAFPELGRVTRGGIHYVHGQPISQTAFAQDPLNPIRESAVSANLAAQSSVPVTILTSQSEVSTVEDGFWVFDCESNEDLKRIGERLKNANHHRVLAGSAAFANLLPRLVDFPRIAPERLKASKPILLVNGSVNERALSQITHVKDETFRRLRMPPSLLLGNDNSYSSEEMRFLAGEGVDNRGNLLLYSISNREGVSDFCRQGALAGLGEHEVHLRVARNTGELVKTLLESCGFGTLVVFGGDTLTGIAQACGWSGFIPRTEAGPGITVANPTASELAVISKAGGFGDLNVVDTILEFVRSHA